jgi:hypothetical protein
MGGPPFNEACTSGTIRIDVAQGTNAVLTTNGAITGGMTGSLSVEIPSYGLLTQIQVTTSCTAGSATRMMGSTPQFVPVGYGSVNIVMGRPSTCVQLSQPTLLHPTIGQQFVRLGANVVAMGGVDASEVGNAQLQVLDTVTLTHLATPGQLDALTVPIGRAHALRLNDTEILFVSSLLTGTYDASPNVAATARYRALAHSAHDGAGDESAFVQLSNGFAIVGGSQGDSPVTGITWISATGEVMPGGLLMFARRRPAAVYVQNKLIIAGGQGPGEPLFEIVASGSTDTAIPFGTQTEQRFAPVLTTDVHHTRALLTLGSSDALDDTMQMATSYELSACTLSAPTPGCMVASGPVFPDAPRARVTVVEHHVGGATQGTDDYETLLIGGFETTTSSSSLFLDRVHFDDARVTIVPAGMAPAGMLINPRQLPGATEIGGGIVLVGGGADDRGNPIPTVELCFPENLAPISSL